MATEAYRDQVRLLLDVLPLVMEEAVFALKGGTAINLFEWDMPRLSVDIDLTYLPTQGREESLAAISGALNRVAANIERRLAPTKVTKPVQGGERMEVKLNCQRQRTQVKIEVNPTLRGHLMPVRVMPCSDSVQDQFEAFTEARVLSRGELFGGKICAALDRQHPRDLFDVKLMLERYGLTEEIRHGMVAALVSHKQPVIELIRPTPKDQRDAFKAKFEGMTLLPFSYDDHVATLERLVQAIRSELTEDDLAFLRSFEAGDPAWDRFQLAGLDELSAPQFKLLNIRKFRQEQPARHAVSLTALESYVADDPKDALLRQPK
jgi:predicted nucleotidyltransferase component of viral defense system